MIQKQEYYLSKNQDNSLKSLWIGELEQWMDSKYLIESCRSYSKFYFSKLYK